MTVRAEVFRALGTLAEPRDPRHSAIAAALGLEGEPAPGDHADVFLFGAYPYASVYVGAEGMLGGEARDRVAGFWRALGMTPPSEPDHLAALLGLYAALIEDEARLHEGGDLAAATLRRATRRALLWEHLFSWLTPYLAKVGQLAAPYYSGWARLLGDMLADEARVVGRQESLPLHLRAAPGLPELDASGAEWVSAVLAPVRSGVIVTSWDLRRAAAALGLGARVGERAFVLRSMLEQDARGTVGWLADEAGRAALAHAESEGLLGAVAAFWRRRAEACEVALRSAQPAEREVVLSHGS
jgi:Nitrate reductase delta subunit